MIVEFFGPPGVGKTTFTHGLGARLQEDGIPVDLLLSYRPAETSGDRAGATGRSRGSPSAVIRRLSRPTVEFLGTACRQLGGSPTGGVAADLLTLFPPRNMMRAIRLRQYLVRLEQAWYRAARAQLVVLCDQGFLQAIASLIVLGAAGDAAGLPRALALLPTADVVVRLDAPMHVLAKRLERRLRDQSRLERLLEHDLAENLAFVPVINQLNAALMAQERPPIQARCSDPQALHGGIDLVAEAARAAWHAAGRTAAA